MKMQAIQNMLLTAQEHLAAFEPPTDDERADYALGLALLDQAILTTKEALAEQRDEELRTLDPGPMSQGGRTV